MTNKKTSIKSIYIILFIMTNIYDNGKIYKLICDDDHYYIGSTTQKLNHRFNNHKTSAKTGTSKAYTYINSIGWDKVKIELVEDFPCTIKSELNTREEYYISKSKSDQLCLNINSALLTPEKRKEYNSNHYEKHKNDKPILCKLCNGKYSSFNKYHHLKTKKHINSLKL